MQYPLADTYLAFVVDTLAEIEPSLLELEVAGESVEDDVLSTLYRAAHSLRTSACIMQYGELERAAYILEAGLEQVRKHGASLGVEGVKHAVRLFSRFATAAEFGDASELTESIETLEVLFPDAAARDNDCGLTLPEGGITLKVPQYIVQQCSGDEVHVYMLRFSMIHDILEKGITPFDFLDFLQKSGHILSVHLPYTSEEPLMAGIEVELLTDQHMYVLYASILDDDLLCSVFLLGDNDVQKLDLNDVTSCEITWDFESLEPTQISQPLPDNNATLDDVDALLVEFDNAMRESRRKAEVAFEPYDGDLEALSPHLAGISGNFSNFSGHENNAATDAERILMSELESVDAIDEDKPASSGSPKVQPACIDLAELLLEAVPPKPKADGPLTEDVLNALFEDMEETLQTTLAGGNAPEKGIVTGADVEAMVGESALELNANTLSDEERLAQLEAELDAALLVEAANEKVTSDEPDDVSAIGGDDNVFANAKLDVEEFFEVSSDQGVSEQYESLDLAQDTEEFPLEMELVDAVEIVSETENVTLEAIPSIDEPSFEQLQFNDAAAEENLEEDSNGSDDPFSHEALLKEFEAAEAAMTGGQVDTLDVDMDTEADGEAEASIATGSDDDFFADSGVEPDMSYLNDDLPNNAMGAGLSLDLESVEKDLLHGFEVEVDAGLATLKLDGELRIGRSGQLKEVLLDLFQEHKEVAVDTSALEAIDLTFIQIMIAADKTAQKRGVELTTCGTVPPCVKDALQSCGLRGDNADRFELAHLFT